MQLSRLSALATAAAAVVVAAVWASDLSLAKTGTIE
jgi:hypothetical protein